jgi:hypothetical protein
MKHKRVLALIALTSISILAVWAWLTMGSKQKVTGVVESMQPPTCTQNVSNSTCGDGTLRVRTENGAVNEYKYASDKAESGEFNITSIQKGTKVELTISQGKISKVELK